MRDLSNLNVVNVYTVTFTKEALPSLDTLSISGSTGAKLEPVFERTTYTYNMSVPFDSSSVCFSMTFDTASYTSSIQVGGGAPVEVEENSVPCVEIPFGKIDITIAVTSRTTGVSGSYIIASSRKVAPYLASLSLTPNGFTPSFDSSTNMYYATVGYQTDAVKTLYSAFRRRLIWLPKPIALCMCPLEPAGERN